MRNVRGFTLVELMIVIAIIAIIATIAIPNLLSSRLSSNETAAIAAMRTLVTSQAQFQATRRADLNYNGVGEYGTLAEMSGAVGVRGGASINPPVLSSGFRIVSANGEVTRNGYQYAVYLPDIAGDGLAELPGGGADGNVDPDVAETTWCCYAWPTNVGSSGRRTFFVNQGGDVLFTDYDVYSGPANGPLPGAAMGGGGSANSITGSTASGATGRDGNFWKTAGN